MDVINIFLFFGFLLTFLTLNTISVLVRRYYHIKQQSQQSIFSLVFNRLSLSFQILVSFQRCLGMASTFESVKDFLNSHLTITMSICILFEFHYTFSCVYLIGFCIVRIICVVNNSFVEETIGEKSIRYILAVTSYSGGLFVCSALYVNNDTNNVTIFNMMTGQTIFPGTIIFVIYNRRMLRVKNMYAYMKK